MQLRTEQQVDLASHVTLCESEQPCPYGIDMTQMSNVHHRAVNLAQAGRLAEGVGMAPQMSAVTGAVHGLLGSADALLNRGASAALCSWHGVASGNGGSRLGRTWVTVSCAPGAL